MIDVRDVDESGWTFYCPECEKKFKTKIQTRLEFGMGKGLCTKRFVKRHEGCGESSVLEQIKHNLEGIDGDLALSLVRDNPKANWDEIRTIYRQTIDSLVEE